MRGRHHGAMAYVLARSDLRLGPRYRTWKLWSRQSKIRPHLSHYQYRAVDRGLQQYLLPQANVVDPQFKR